EAVADTNKTNPTSATNKQRKILIKLAAAALSATAWLRQRISSIVSQIQPKSQQNSVARAPLRLRSGQALARERREPRRFRHPLAGGKLPARSAVEGFLLIQSEHSDRTNTEDRLFIRENIFFETRHIEFVLTLVKRKYSPEQRSIPHPLSHSFNNHSLIRPLRTNHTSRISIQVLCLTRL